MNDPKELRVVRASDLEARGPSDPSWLIENLWGSGAVGLIGGSPKSCKTFLALEMAVAVASGRPCLGRYAVPNPGPVLVYPAEDSPIQVRERLEQLAQARQVDFQTLNVHLIVEPSLRLDVPDDQQRLRSTLSLHRPKFLVLDPWVRLQRAHENDATQVSAILADLRDVSRGYELALALVHHARKEPTEEPGQAFRGSGDFYAWADSMLYLRRRRETLTLWVEHRSGAAPPPVGLQLVAKGGPVRLEVRETTLAAQELRLADRVLELLAELGPCWQAPLRDKLKIRKQDLTDVLRELEAAGRVIRSSDGWSLVNGR